MHIGVCREDRFLHVCIWIWIELPSHQLAGQLDIRIFALRLRIELFVYHSLRSQYLSRGTQSLIPWQASRDPSRPPRGWTGRRRGTPNPGTLLWPTALRARHPQQRRGTPSSSAAIRTLTMTPRAYPKPTLIAGAPHPHAFSSTSLIIDLTSRKGLFRTTVGGDMGRSDSE